MKREKIPKTLNLKILSQSIFIPETFFGHNFEQNYVSFQFCEPMPIPMSNQKKSISKTKKNVCNLSFFCNRFLSLFC